MKAMENVRYALKQRYTASKEKARYLLQVHVAKVSDGALYGSIVEKQSLGKSDLGLKWKFAKASLWRGTSISKIYQEGEVRISENYELGDYFDPNNQGERCVLQRLAPQCSHHIVLKIGLDHTNSN